MHYQTGRLREMLKSGRRRFCLAAFGFLLLGGCGVGSGGSDSGSGSGAGGDSGTPPEQLSIKLEGQTKYRADEGVSLGYTVSGSSAASATVTYDGPVELNHDAEKKTISGDALLPGTHPVKVTATAGSYSSEDEITLFIDANFGGQYGGGGESQFSLTMGRSQVTETDENNYVLTRSGTLYWYSQATDATEFVNLLCVADVEVNGDQALGSGLCKEVVDDQLQVRTVTGLIVTYKKTGVFLKIWALKKTTVFYRSLFIKTGLFLKVRVFTEKSGFFSKNGVLPQKTGFFPKKSAIFVRDKS